MGGSRGLFISGLSPLTVQHLNHYVTKLGMIMFLILVRFLVRVITFLQQDSVAEDCYWVSNSTFSRLVPAVANTIRNEKYPT